MRSRTRSPLPTTHQAEAQPRLAVTLHLDHFTPTPEGFSLASHFGLNCIPQRCVDLLAPSTSECDLIWK